MRAWETKNRELRTDWRWFDNQAEGVVAVSWRANIKKGAQIAAGTALADIYFTDGSAVELTAPAGCAGIIAATNRKLVKHGMPLPPSQLFLRLE